MPYFLGAVAEDIQAKIKAHKEALDKFNSRKDKHLAEASRLRTELDKLNRSGGLASTKVFQAQRLEKSIKAKVKAASEVAAKAKLEEAAILKLSNTPAESVPVTIVDQLPDIADIVDKAKGQKIPAWMYLAGAGVGALMLRKLLK